MSSIDLRLVLVDTEGEEYCATFDLNGLTTTTTIPYSAFQTQCWLGAGAGVAFFPAMHAIDMIRLYVPQNTDTTPVNYDICWNDITFN